MTEDGISVARVHYSADQGKAGDDWLKAQLTGYPGGKNGIAWRKEMEIDFSVFGGKAVYPEFDRAWHVSDVPLLPLVIEGITKRNNLVINGWDNTGLSPACISTYINGIGQWMIFKEFCGEDIGIEEFGDVAKMWWGTELPPNVRFTHIGDPAGRIRDSRKKSPAIYLQEHCGIRIHDGIQTFKVRRECIAQRLTRRITGGEPAILIDPSCTMLIMGFEGGYCYPEIGNTGYYATDPKKNEYSHCVTWDTAVSTPKGSFPIAVLDVGSYVDTPRGPCRVSATMTRIVKDAIRVFTSDGSYVDCTPDHPFFVNKTLVRADALQYNDILECIEPNKDKKRWADRLNIQSKNSTGSSFIGSLQDIIRRTIGSMARFTCTAMSGLSLMVQSLKDTTSTIIPIGTEPIMLSGTLHSKQAARMLPATPRKGLLKIQNWRSEESLQHKKLLRYGTPLKQEETGIANTENEHGNANQPNTNASSVGKNTRQKPASEGFVLCLARVKVAAHQAWMMLIERVLSVDCLSNLINTRARKPVLRFVRSAPLTGPRRVYDLTIEGEHCFYANGILVGNCHDATQYAASILFGPKDDREDDEDEDDNVRLSNDGRSRIGGY